MTAPLKHRLRTTCAAALVTIATVAIAMPTAWADVQTGVRRYEDGDYKGAIQEWLPLAAQNEPNALFNLGQVFRLGRGVDKNMETARNYYERASQLGHVSAQGNLATLYFFAESSSVRDRDRAISWWQEAAANGDARSQYMLGVLYFNGDVVERDWRKAYAWMSLASASGLPEAGEAEGSMLKHLTAAQVTDAKELSVSLVNPAGAFPSSMPIQFTRPKGTPTPAKVVPASAAPATPPIEDMVPASAPAGVGAPAEDGMSLVKANDMPSPAASDMSETAAQDSLKDTQPQENVIVSIAEAAAIEAASQAPEPVVEQPPVQVAAAMPTQNGMPVNDAAMDLDEAPAPFSQAFPWRLQLAAFSTEASAERAWTMISGKNADVLASLSPRVVEADLGERVLYRLFADGFSTKDDARNACQNLKAAGQGCMLVKAPAQ